MNISKLLLFLALASCLGIDAARAETARVHYEGFDSHDIEIYFEYAGDGQNWLVQPPPLTLQKNEIALGFQGRDKSGVVLREWIRPNDNFLGYHVTTEGSLQALKVVFQPTNGLADRIHVPLWGSRQLRVISGYFGNEDRGDSLVQVFTADTFKMDGTEYLVRSLSPTSATLRSTVSGEEITIPLSPTGKLRMENLQLKRELKQLQNDFWSLRNYSTDTPAIYLVLVFLFVGFVLAYFCILLGLLTLEDLSVKRAKPYRPPQERR